MCMWWKRRDPCLIQALDEYWVCHHESTCIYRFFFLLRCESSQIVRIIIIIIMIIIIMIAPNWNTSINLFTEIKETAEDTILATAIQINLVPIIPVIHCDYPDPINLDEDEEEEEDGDDCASNTLKRKLGWWWQQWQWWGAISQTCVQAVSIFFIISLPLYFWNSFKFNSLKVILQAAPK